MNGQIAIGVGVCVSLGITGAILWFMPRLKPSAQVFSPLGKALILSLYFILSACAVFLWLKWESIPQRFPIHWGASGEPNGWATKSFLAVYMMLIVGTVTCTFILGMARSIKTDGRTHVSDPKAPSRGQSLEFMGPLMIGISYMTVVPMALFSVWLPFRGLEESPMVFILCMAAATTALTAIGLIIFAKLKPYEANVQTSANDEQNVIIDTTQDYCWKWGVFYYNPNDPALWVDKRFGVGSTPNMANKRSWLIMAAICAYIVFIINSAIFMIGTV